MERITMVLKADQLNLPEHFAKKLRGKKIELVETKEGILIKPIEDPTKELRGFLEGGVNLQLRHIWLKNDKIKSLSNE